MSDVLSYINDPNKTGVYCISISVTISSLNELFKEIDKESKSSDRFKLPKEERIARAPSSYVARIAGEDIATALDYLSILQPSKGILSSPKVLPVREFKAISPRDMGFSEHLGHPHFASWSGGFIAPNLTLVGTKDAIYTKMRYVENELRLNIISMNEKGCKVFEELFESIPIINRDIKISKINQKYSSRYCSEPMIAAIVLWMNTLGHAMVPEDIHKYLQSSVVYYEKEEWRISILLAAIAVESILAEIYEEYYHEVAPSDPLGLLKDKIERKTKFPPSVLKNIELVNQCRISAVHRSSTPVGSKEARNAVVEATKFIHWSFFGGPLCMELKSKSKIQADLITK